MPPTRELVLATLHARLQPLAALVLRDAVLPERIPPAGQIVLNDGEPEVTLSPLRYHYEHRAELEVVGQAGKLRKRLDLARDAEGAMDGVPGLIVTNWVEGKV